MIHSKFSRGQASLEMTVAFLGALLLLFGSFKVFFWVTERIVSRQQSYEQTRSTGADFVEPSKPLRILGEP